MEIQVLHLNFRSLHTSGSLSLPTFALTEIDVVGGLCKYFECEVLLVTLFSFCEFIVQTEWFVVRTRIDDTCVEELQHALWFYAPSRPCVLLCLQWRTLDCLGLWFFTSLSNLERQLSSVGVLFPLGTESYIVKHIMWVYVSNHDSRLVYSSSCYGSFSIECLTFDSRAAVLRLCLAGLFLKPTSDWVLKHVLFCKLFVMVHYLDILYDWLALIVPRKLIEFLCVAHGCIQLSLSFKLILQ